MLFPQVVREISDSMKRGAALETALKEVAEVRRDIVAKMFVQVLQEVKAGKPLAESLRTFAARTGSTAVDRTVSVINLSLEAGGSVSEILDRITEELWSAYLLRFERKQKTRFQSNFILYGGSLFTPLMLGILLANFALGPVKLDIGGLMNAVTMFLLASSVCSTLMHGLIKGKPKDSAKVIPIFMFIAYLSFQLSLALRLA